MSDLYELWGQLQFHLTEYGLRDFPVLLEIWQSIVNITIKYYPDVARALYYVVDVIFCPKQIVKQIIVFACAQFSIIVLHRCGGLVEFFKSFIFSRDAKIRKLQSTMRKSADYYEWRRLAGQLDEVLGNLDWIEEDFSPLYDCHKVKQQVNMIDRMVYSWDTFNLMFRLRSSLSRNQYGIMHEGLFSKAHSGTKRLIKQYHETVVNGLLYIANSEGDEEVSECEITQHTLFATSSAQRDDNNVCS
jgi:hypothetical protein